jgi:hypothetical protein
MWATAVWRNLLTIPSSCCCSCCLLQGAVLRPFCRIKIIFKSCRHGDQQTE